MKLIELVDAEQKDPALDAKKRQLVQLGRQLESASKQMAGFKKANRENPALEKRIEQLKEKIRKIKETMIDELEIKK